MSEEVGAKYWTKLMWACVYNLSRLILSSFYLYLSFAEKIHSF